MGGVDLLVAFPGVLSPPRDAFFENEGVDVWDGRYLQRQARLFGVIVPDFVAVLEEKSQLKTGSERKSCFAAWPVSDPVGRTGRSMKAFAKLL
jgi:hypothetical protein